MQPHWYVIYINSFNNLWYNLKKDTGPVIAYPVLYNTPFKGLFLVILTLLNVNYIKNTQLN